MPRRGLPDSVAMRHDEHYVEALAASAGAPVGRIVPLDLIDPNPNQPRQVMGDLSELIASISEKGVIEPLIVRQRGERFQIVAGERRYHASVQAGLRELPVVLRDVDDTEIIELALIENLQRKDLTPFEEAKALHSLAERCGYTREDLAQRLGKSRSSITESLATEYDERLRQAFDVLVDDLHREIAARLASLRAALSDWVREGRDAAIAEAMRETRADVEQETGERVSDANTPASTGAQAELTEVHKAAANRLVEAVRAIDGGQSLSEILDVLIAASSTEVGRAAIFLRQGQTLKSWRLAGFDALGYDGSSMEFQFADGGMIAEAAESAQSIRLEPGASRSAQPPPLANLPGQSLAVALPLVMSEHVFAVLYVDDGTHESAARTSWPGTIEVLARHAARALEAITATRLAQVADVVYLDRR